ncbi:hypothetical protein BJV74DRAFT_891620 [Russula compacta]|nr:hypothetical protein BJV74DRAFT_891620 [Russula compacta]
MSDELFELLFPQLALSPSLASTNIPAEPRLLLLKKAHTHDTFLIDGLHRRSCLCLRSTIPSASDTSRSNAPSSRSPVVQAFSSSEAIAIRALSSSASSSCTCASDLLEVLFRGSL